MLLLWSAGDADLSCHECFDNSEQTSSHRLGFANTRERRATIYSYSYVSSLVRLRGSLAAQWEAPGHTEMCRADGVLSYAKVPQRSLQRLCWGVIRCLRGGGVAVATWAKMDTDWWLLMPANDGDFKVWVTIRIRRGSPSFDRTRSAVRRALLFFLTMLLLWSAGDADLNDTIPFLW